MNADLNTSTVQAFLTKLWTLVDDPSTNNLICWDTSGRMFHVLDQVQFAQTILPCYFKHNNISSFIRQLNMYGFKKVMSINTSNMKSEREDITFAHPCFLRGQKNLLDNIKRKTPSQTLLLSKNNESQVSGELSGIKDQIESMTENMDNLRLENELLWKEVVNLGLKYKRQEQVVSKLVNVIVAFMNQDRNLKHNVPLMIKSFIDSDDGAQQVDKLVPVSKSPRRVTMLPTASISRVNSLDSSDKQLESLALVGFDPETSPHLSDLSTFEEFVPFDDVQLPQSSSKELVPVSEPRLVFNPLVQIDFDMDELNKHWSSFPDITCDFLNNGETEEPAEEEVPQPNKRAKLDDDSLGKELVQYIPQDEIFIPNDAMAGPAISDTFQISDDAEIFNPLSFLDMGYLDEHQN